jgi:hypothetical protein
MTIEPDGAIVRRGYMPGGPPLDAALRVLDEEPPECVPA